MSKSGRVRFNGVLVATSWPEILMSSQTQTTYLIGGKVYQRVPYGSEPEDWGAHQAPCHDCAAVKGQLHAVGCDVERCPVCGGQVISCDCLYDQTADGFDFKSHQEAAVSAYYKRLDYFKAFAHITRRIVHEALTRRHIKVQSVEAREKDPESFGKKAATPLETDPTKPRYPRPLEQITDLAGVRVITYFPNTLGDVDKLIKEEFDVQERSDRGELLIEQERFGYSSVHYLVRLSKSRIQLPEYAEYSGAIAEIQVRTVLQHAWAEIEHDIQYKSSSVIPSVIRRRFVALAGMLEIADREFQAVQDEDQRLRQRAREKIKQGDFEKVEITPDALRAFLQKAVGSDDRISAFSYDFLARTLREMGFRTLRQIEKCISQFDDDQLSRIAWGYRQGRSLGLNCSYLRGWENSISSGIPGGNTNGSGNGTSEFLKSSGKPE
jgi:putative GTP pyrophosphokinase